jgi:hypothetical protein
MTNPIPRTIEQLSKWCDHEYTQVAGYYIEDDHYVFVFSDKGGTVIHVHYDHHIPTRWEVILQSKINQLQEKFIAA